MKTVIKAIEFGDREFSSKLELFKALQASATEIIDLKKAQLITSDSVKMLPFKEGVELGKSLTLEEGFIYPVINTTKYMDSHNDVHFNGIWDHSLKDQKGKIYYLANHQLEVGKVIAYPKDVEMMVEELEWKFLGADYPGKTQALIFKVNKNNIRLQDAKDIINEKIDIEHSVRMQYVTIYLAVNSEDSDYKEEKATYDKYISMVANKSVAEEKGYFWAVTEAKIHKEGSMVLAGSNDITPMIHAKISGPTDVTPKAEPPEGTQTKNNLLTNLLTN